MHKGAGLPRQALDCVRKLDSLHKVNSSCGKCEVQSTTAVCCTSLDVLIYSKIEFAWIGRLRLGITGN